MAVAGPVAIGAPMAAADLRPYPCVCSASGELGTPKIRSGRPSATPGGMEMSNAWLGGRRLLARSRTPRRRSVVVAAELGGQYEEGFEDVHQQLVNYFTYKAVRTVLHQLYEMNPPKYMWFYNFVATTKPDDAKRFLRTLAKKCDHAKMYQRISDENLELMRERLMETVIWPSDDTNTEKIG
ncbi:hypothetical protein Taro_051365 [Colocasia esculenta]|uniref:Chaperonin-like RbcX protein n=1 Tax=Colocasia esculenta TaxID=4460 RepID=A0A843XGR9_COLES|nr:hypothetical protein [Colocasia esculenta]